MWRRRRALAALAACMAISPAARAQDKEARLSAPQVFALAEVYEAEGRRADAEALLEALTRDPNPQYRAEARFRLGQARMASGDYEGAIDAFAALLEEQPDAQPVRLALARALALAGRTGAASRELRRAEAAGLPENVQRLVDRFGDVLRRSRPYGVTIEVGLAPDSNINQATDSSTIEIGDFPLTLDESGQANSGIGLTGSVDAFASLPLGGGTTMVNRVAASGNLYRKDQFNDLFLSASSGPEFVIGRAVARLAGTYSWRRVGDHRYSQGLGGSLQVRAPLGKAQQIGATLAVSDQDYRIAEQSGLQYFAAASFEEALTPRIYGRIDVSITRQNAKADAYATTSYGGSASLSRDTGPMTVFARAGYTRTGADGPFALFGAARADDRIDLSLGASWTRWSIAGLVPTVRLQQTFNSSPLDLYSFKRTRLEFALSEQF